MGTEKMNKKAELTISKLVINLLIVIGIFTVAFTFLDENADSAGVTLDSKYENASDALLDEQSSLNTNVQSIKTAVININEADSSLQVAWNGLVGVGAAIKLPISFVGTSIEVLGATLGLGIIPGWLVTLLTIGIIAIVVLLILAALKGEAKL